MVRSLQNSVSLLSRMVLQERQNGEHVTDPQVASPDELNAATAGQNSAYSPCISPYLYITAQETLLRCRT